MVQSTAGESVAIRPVTFLQTAHIAKRLNDPRTAQASHLAAGQAMPGWIRPPGMFQTVSTPLYYHWSTSGFDVFIDEHAAGWVFLRSWHRIFYIDALLVDPEWEGHGIKTMLLRFAEQQAYELKHDWMGLTLTPAGGTAYAPFEALGYRGTACEMMHHSGGEMLLPEANGHVTLKPLYGRTGQAVYRRFARLDLAGDGLDVPALLPYLIKRPGGGAARRWLVTVEGQEAAYLSLTQRAEKLSATLAAGPEWWGHEALLAALGEAVKRAGAAQPLDVRFTSAGHTEAARAALAAHGFEVRPAAETRLFKKPEAQTNLIGSMLH